MHLIVVGLNHRTAPVELRERLAIPDHELPTALLALQTHGAVSECAILSTCNRAEVHALTSRDAEHLTAFLREYHSVPQDDLAGHVYSHEGVHAASHLFRVASGLDSLVLGESQILRQVRDAFDAATEQGASGPVLNALFRAAISTGKRAQTETGIGKGGFSIGHAAVDLARSIFGSLEGARILILGAGKMSELTARHLAASGAKFILVANRTHTRAESIAGRLGGEAIRYDDFPDALVHSDIVISSTAAPHPIIDRETVIPAMRKRRGRPLFLIDIAVPRDVAHDVASLDNVFLYDIDDLENVVSDMSRDRALEAHKVESIVHEEAARFMAWWRALEAVPVVSRLRDKHESFRQAEIERLRHQLPDLPNHAWERIEAATRSLLTRVHRDPIERIKSAAVSGDSDNTFTLLDAARHIFALPDPPEPEPEHETLPTDSPGRVIKQSGAEDEAGVAGTTENGSAPRRSKRDTPDDLPTIAKSSRLKPAEGKQ